MRKRLLIGAIAAAVIGVAAYVLSQPSEGTVRWYKKEYIREMSKASGRKWFTPVEDLYCKIVNKPLRRTRPTREAFMHLKRGNNARVTLHNMGFLAVCRFAITNVSREEAAARIWKERKPGFSRDEDVFVNFTYPTTDTNMLVIEGVAKDMAKWEAAIRQADVPEPK